MIAAAWRWLHQPSGIVRWLRRPAPVSRAWVIGAFILVEIDFFPDGALRGLAFIVAAVFWIWMRKPETHG